ncbi:MAG: hypothetical protein FJ030_13685 [Chloroflexi bacterium]|nr:hypothetical protein [Chloroflexota bacterium]
MTDKSLAAKKAWATRNSPKYKARRSETASKQALANWCKSNGWKILFFEGESGAPRTGIVDAMIARIASNDADTLDIRLIQIKSGTAGLTAAEISRLKQALDKASVNWLLAAFDGEAIHFLPEMRRKK